MQTTLNLSNFFYCSKREQFLNDTVERLQNQKWGWNGTDNSAFKSLSEEGKKDFTGKILKAMDLRNEIHARRKAAMRESGVFAAMDQIESTFKKY